MRTWLHVFLSISICFFSFLPNVNAQWLQTSGPQGGTLYSIASNGSSTIFASQSANGVYRSTDNGAHWTQSGLFGNPIGTFCFTSTAVFAADQNSGIYRSKDNGNSWSKFLQDDFVWTIGSKGNYLFAAIYDTLPRIIRSADNGSTWSSLPDVVSRQPYYAFASNDKYVFAAGIDYVARSSDNGLHWSNFVNGLPPGTQYSSVITKGAYVFLGAYGNTGVYRSPDNGQNWIFSGLSNLTIKSFAVSGNSLFALTEDYDGSATPGIYRSNDNGLTWTLVNNDIVSAKINSIGANNNFVFAGMGEMGLSRSASKGDDWVWMKNAGFRTMTLNSIVNLGNDIYTCNTGAGIYYSASNGNSWTDYNIGLPSMNVKCLAVNKDKYIVYAGTDMGVFKTAPGLQTWTPVNEGLGDLDIMTIAVDAKTLYAGTYFGGIFKSTNAGTTWDTTSVQYGRFTMSAVGTDAVYMVQTNTHSRPWRSLFASYDKGITWNEVFSSYQYELINSVAASGNYVFLGNEDGIYVSSDRGQSWKKSNALIKDTCITSMYFANGTVIAGNSTGGVYKSNDNGKSWNLINSGIPLNSPVNCLGSNNRNFFAGSLANSIWKTGLGTDSPDMITGINGPEKYSLMQNYPNPFNPSTRIRYSLAFDGNVTLKIFDAAGREISELINGKQSAGYHEFVFDASRLASGVYFYELASGTFREIKKMILVK